MSPIFGKPSRQIIVSGALAILSAASSSLPAQATTKGLNQIVTPDIQPPNSFSISAQVQHPAIGNANQLQLEVGITKNFELALFQGFSPPQTIGGVEYGLVQRGPYLLSTGFINYLFRGTGVQPFLEAGYYKGRSKYIVGGIRVAGRNEGILGYAYQATKRVQLQLDYQSGRDNFATAGFTYNIRPNLQFNPALYFSNSSPRHAYGYAVLTLNIETGKHSSQNPAAPNADGQGGGKRKPSPVEATQSTQQH